MGIQHYKLLGLSIFLMLSLSCNAATASVRVVGTMHCTDCIRHGLSISPESSSGINVSVTCKTKEKMTQGNGAVDDNGRFTIMLSDEWNGRNSVEGCFAKLQSASASKPCPIHTAQTASIKLFGTERNAATDEQIKFSPVTCQSALFWLPPNFTFFHNTPPSPEQPVEDAPPPVLLPAQPPLAEFPPAAPEIETPSPQPDDNPLPAPEPAVQSPPHYPPAVSPIPNPGPQLPNQIPPPFASPPFPPRRLRKKPHPSLTFPPINQPFPNPSPSPQSPTPIHPPNFNHPVPKFPLKPDPFRKQPLPIPPPAGIPKRIKPSPIPRAPPVPRLPRTPTAPRKYFNSPQPKADPPNST